MSARPFIESAEEARLILARTPRTAEMALLIIDAHRALDHYERIERIHREAVRSFDQACATMAATATPELQLPAPARDPAQLELVA